MSGDIPVDAAVNEKEPSSTTNEDQLFDGLVSSGKEAPSVHPEFELHLLSDEEKGNDGTGDESDSEDEEYAPDGGWGWWCVLGCALSLFVISGFERSGGVILLELQDTFSSKSAPTAWVISLSATLRLLCGPVASVLSNKFSCRSVVLVGGLVFSLGVLISSYVPYFGFLYATYGVFCGLGKSLAYTPGLVIVGVYFKDKRGLAVGLATAGGGLGTLLLPPLFDWLFEEFRYRGAMLILTGISLQICISGSLYMPLEKYLKIASKSDDGLENPQNDTDECMALKGDDTRKLSTSRSFQRTSVTSFMSEEYHIAESQGSVGKKKKSNKHNKETEDSAKEKKKLLDCSMMRNPLFVSLCIAILFLALAFNSVLVFIPPLARSIGLSSMQGAYVISIAGISDTFSRLFSGLILDIKKVKPYRMFVYNTALFMLSILTFCLTFVTRFSHLMIIAALYGIFIGTYSSQKSVILADLLGVESLASSFGILLCFQGVGTLVGPPIIGEMRDKSSSFANGFYFAAGINLLGALILTSGNVIQFLLKRLHEKKKLQDATNDNANSHKVL